MRRFTILGCGSSPGVPRITGDWGACDPANPKNRRTRAAFLVEQIGPEGKTTVVIDTGPDFRAQMIAARVDRLDAAIYTHAHADHIHGIDDLRGYALVQRRRIDVHADRTTMDRLDEAFGYCFRAPPGSGYPPILTEHRLTSGDPVTIQGQGGSIEALPVLQDHGDIPSLGFRFGNVAYSADVKDLPPESVEALAGLDVWIVDALRKHPHPSHFNLDEALDWIARIKPKRAILTNMHTDMDYNALRAILPAHVEPAFDGLQFEA